MRSVHDTVYAEEITDRTFDKAKEKIEQGRYREKDKLINWLYRIARNMHFDDARKKQRHPTVGLTEGIAIADVSREEINEEAIIEKAKVYLIGMALHECSRHERLAFILSYIKGIGWEQVGSRLGIKPESARKEAYRCREHVKTKLLCLDNILTKKVIRKLSQNISLLRYIIKRELYKNEKQKIK
jgi:RNA polymerase sigma factor (sigma-70 family)